MASKAFAWCRARKEKFTFVCSGEEAKILDHQIQQLKVLPGLALAYACWFTKEEMIDMFERISQQEIQHGDFRRSSEVLPACLEVLPAPQRFLSCYGQIFTTCWTRKN